MSEFSRPAHDPSDLAVAVENVTVQYRTNVDKVPTLKTTLRRLGRRTRSVRRITALKGVSVDVPRGSVLGIIGANGAGKTTLLRTIAGILPPTEGRVTVRGEITALLTMGVGFNRALSGRENIFLGSLASGRMPDEIEGQMDEIIAFADLGEFIDMPVNTYSSGMRGRLAFSVGVNISPDILLVDEALSAGDANFRQKATRRMQKLVENAGTIVLVSHGLGHIEKLGTHCLWLHKGQVMGFGEPRDMIKEYTEFVNVKQSEVMEDI